MNDDDNKPKKDQGDELEEAYRDTGGQTAAETGELSALTESGGGEPMDIDKARKAFDEDNDDDGVKPVDSEDL